MSECSNVEMREWLPDLLYGRLPAGARASVEAHVDGCAPCRAELELLARVRDVVRAPAIDARRVSSAIPPYRPRSLWVRATQSPVLRIAAAVVLVAGAAWLTRRQPAVETRTAGSSQVTPPAPAAVAAVPASTPELVVGEPLADLTDGDLHTLIEELDQLDAVTPVEADVDLPSIRGGD
jgi:anti-sigma factor RsiW